ncbi:MAG TPA: uracil-DNA glycosylase [Dehalococcoidia bacterium]|nr:uracil-DNA glycosylase [Dehalococcoidia bacterium]
MAPLSLEERAAALAELYEQIARCTDCELYRSRTRTVPGEGPPNAEIMFVGEAPGWHEDRTGRPFVGPAGHYLDELLALAGLKREEVYIGNVIKSRPPNNRDPLPREIEACSKWLKRQIEVIQPRVIVTLGRHSLAWLFSEGSISKVHGAARLTDDGIIAIPMFHPAAALHQQRFRELIEEDFRKLPALIAEAEALLEKRMEATPQAQQMRLL